MESLKFPTPINTLMRLSHVLVAIAATFLVTSEAFSTTTDSNEAEISKVALSGGPSQRMLRTHHNIYEDKEDEEDEEDEEERGLSSLKMKFMRSQGMSADDYAEKLGIAAKMKGFESNPRGFQAFLETDKYEKYKTYLNYLKSKKKK
ncbi:hypothetical protein BBO99_00009020 [Phytophthora kernoviae]|uniref:PexRD2 WYL domain-containing protein n=2 Tax=Phytophthora kernoviae TaxID=325452 RepID=A0A3R7JBX1_9STRA|nr:hypothetical protein G195_011462 [Phytophthora kernoviae 00238/432]RLN32375.1 hypothetical protein BBI17_009030 [Phytophthora kernoviae]RLN74262.1 hypothetical protein BBO99_00009020 [Phytophthora kernoviae]